MANKKLFEPGDMVVTFRGQAGMVVAEDIFTKISACLKEGKRPGYYFAPGCCGNPDYVLQIPVLFEDGTYDTMRAMHIKKSPALPEEKRALFQDIIDSVHP